ncbi:MAG: aspartyl/asparaginyl beta-hydroxylase domain-containing protein [Pseudomonadota bacterium]
MIQKNTQHQATPYLKLPFSFDVGRLQQELDSIAARQWVGHFNTQAYEKNWSCIPLRSLGASLTNVIPVEGGDFQDTEILAGCPYFREVISHFECEKTSIRLMALEPGGVIKPHRDDGASLEDGMTRLHIPVQTSPQVEFCIDGERVHFSAGDTWYLNASCLHGVENRSSVNRVHLMLDCISNAWLENIFVSAGWQARPAPRYPDASIHDGNVLEVIAALRLSGHQAGQAMAARLQAIHDGLNGLQPGP